MELLFVVDTTRLLVAVLLFLNKQSVASQPASQPASLLGNAVYCSVTSAQGDASRRSRFQVCTPRCAHNDVNVLSDNNHIGASSNDGDEAGPRMQCLSPGLVGVFAVGRAMPFCSPLSPFSMFLFAPRLIHYASVACTIIYALSAEKHASAPPQPRLLDVFIEQTSSVATEEERGMGGPQYHSPHSFSQSPHSFAQSYTFNNSSQFKWPSPAFSMSSLGSPVVSLLVNNLTQLSWPWPSPVFLMSSLGSPVVCIVSSLGSPVVSSLGSPVGSHSHHHPSFNNSSQLSWPSPVCSMSSLGSPVVSSLGPPSPVGSHSHHSPQLTQFFQLPAAFADLQPKGGITIVHGNPAW